VAWGSLRTETDLGLTYRLAFDLVGGGPGGGGALRPQCDSPIHPRHRAVVKREAKDAWTMRLALVREVETHDRVVSDFHQLFLMLPAEVLLMAGLAVHHH
jgi:hypothetical protein